MKITLSIVATVLALGALPAGASGPSGERVAAGATFSPVVTRTGRAPTGYAVTFRFRDAKAPRVYLVGEWYFSRPGKTTTTDRQGLLPAQWRPGDFPLGWPDLSTTAGWPIFSMTKDRSTGVWSYTVPLPSGEFNYEFVTDCKLFHGVNSNELTQLGCIILPDPSNPPRNTTGSLEPTSQVYVPSDPAFGTVNYSWEGPTSPKGKLSDVTYPIGSLSYMDGLNQMAIYTPPGYDRHRARPYPTLYLNGGYGSNEVDWSTRADAANILDNLIDKGAIGPVVVVMTNYMFSDCGPDDGSAYLQNLVSNVIPYIVSHYRVSIASTQRAFGGLSCGGALAAYLLFDHAALFGYYAVMSPAAYYGIAALNPPPAVLSAAQARAASHAGVLLGGGLQDPIHPYAVQDLATLQRAGDKVVVDFVAGGHDWYVWRILLRDFLTRVAFKAAGA